MARLGPWIGMVMAVPATVAFTPVPPPAPPPWDPQVVALGQPVQAATPVTPVPAAPAVTTAPAAPAVTPVPAAPAATPAPAAPAATPAPAAPAATPAPAAPATPQSLPPNAGSMPVPDRDVGAIVVDAALTRLGAPYQWAAAGPDTFDCSGLVVWAFQQAGLSLPHSSQALASGGQPVMPDQMQPGDVIILFPDASHVGIYVGGGRMVHAVDESTPVAVESLFRAPINTVRRYR